MTKYLTEHSDIAADCVMGRRELGRVAAKNANALVLIQRTAKSVQRG